MNKSIMKKVISVCLCVSVLVGIASVSNAYSGSIDSGSSDDIESHYVTPGYHNFEYDVTYIYYSGLAVGVFLPDLYMKAEMNVDSDDVCSVNTAHKEGEYLVTSTGTHDYILYNDTAKDVTISISLNEY